MKLSVPPTVATRRGGIILAAFTCFNVCMQLTSALLLKLAPEARRENLVVVGAILAAVLLLNVARFVTWGALHRRFPISVAYPASAIFFPALLAMAWWLGEDVGAAQLLGAGLVLLGVVLILMDQVESP